REAAVERVRGASARALAEPIGFGALLRTAHGLIAPPHQLVIVADHPSAARPFIAAAAHPDVTAVVSGEQAESFAAAGFSLFEGKALLDGRSTAYDCRDFACRLPVTEPALLRGGEA